MDAVSGIAEIQSKFFESLEELKLKELKLVDFETQLQLGQQKLDEDKDRVLEERRKIAQREEELLKEKGLMAKYHVDETDIIELNVQGTLIQTHRTTLIQFEDTYLAGLFNGRWENRVHRDKEGRVFLDFIPTTFRYLLDYLTDLKLSRTGSSVPLPRVPDSHSAEFTVLLKHLGLEEAIYGSPECFSRTLKSSTIVLKDNCMSATSTSDVMGFVLGEGVYYNEAVEFSLEVRMLEEPWIFLGIMEESDRCFQDNSFNGNSRAYGWAGLGGVWVAGEKQHGGQNVPTDKFVGGLRVKILLDCQEEHIPSLSLTVESDNTVYEIKPLPPEKSWRLHVNMVGSQDTLELLGVKKIKV